MLLVYWLLSIGSSKLFPVCMLGLLLSTLYSVPMNGPETE